MKISSWNVNSVRARILNIIDYLKTSEPDVLLVQEIKTEEKNFPYSDFEKIGYKSHVFGQKSYNGVAFISKVKIDKVDLNFLKDKKKQSRIISGNIKIKSLHTPGHANHHISWKYKDMIFAGDVAGAKINDGPVLPACPPPDIDLELWDESLNILNDEAPTKLYLTHFGGSSNVTEHLEELKSCLWDWANWFKKKKNENKDIELLTKEFNAYVHESLVNRGLSKTLIEQYYAANPPYMSVTGLLRYLNKKAKNDK